MEGVGIQNLFTELEDKRQQQNKNVKERDPWDDLGEYGTEDTGPYKT
jgi:hypothetical protein